jgi:hypothetical protein
VAGGAAVGAIAVTGLHQPAAAAKNPFENIRVVGKRRGKRVFVGQLDIKRFVADGGTLYAVGTLSGQLKRNQRSSRISGKRVRVPVTRINGKNLAGLSGADVSAEAVCNVLTLTLGPLDLNLLGLRVQLNQINLRITAITGSLLGDLLCAVANLLSGGPLGNLLNQLAGLLNRILGQLG